MVRVRVRGAASTALTKILVDKGYRIVQASEIVRDRLGLPVDNSPADVTVKDGDEPDSILVIGFYKQASRVYEDLASTLEYVFKWRSPVGLYAVYRGLVKERTNDTCIVNIGYLDGLLRGCRENVGEYTTVSIVKAPLKPRDMPVFSYNIRLVGELVALTYGSRELTISRHIKDPDKRNLLSAIGLSKIMATGFGLHFRSSSSYASIEDIEAEINALVVKMKEILSKAQKAGDGVVELYEGEFIGLIGLTSVAKSKLDEVRGGVVPTILGHHSYKYISRELSNLIDSLEAGLNPRREDIIELSGMVKRKVIESLVNGREVKFIHIKPDGSVHTLKPGVVLKVVETGGYEAFYVKREISSDGVYDGLNVEKKRGDVDYMYFTTNGWFISHNYFRGDDWLGSYININTPPEIGLSVVKYHDLLVDVVVKRNGEAEVKDKEELEEHCTKGWIDEKLCSETIKVVEDILNNTDKYIFKPT